MAEDLCWHQNWMFYRGQLVATQVPPPLLQMLAGDVMAAGDLGNTRTLHATFAQDPELVLARTTVADVRPLSVSLAASFTSS
jgi:hypothetical protein